MPAAARQGVPRHRLHAAPRQRHAVAAARDGRRQGDRVQLRRRHRPGLDHARGRARSPGRDLQPRGAELRRRFLGRAVAHRRRRRARRGQRARVDPPRLPHRPLLPGVDQRDVRPDPGGAAERDHALLPAQSLRRGQALRPLDHRQLPRELQAARLQRHPVQPRVAAARHRVRHPQGHRRRGADQARAGQGASPRQHRRQARLGLRRRLRARRCG